MSSKVATSILGSLLVLSAGCGHKAEQPAQAAKPVGGVGVVDLDVVAKRLGRDIEMNNAVQERVTELNSKLSSLKSSLQDLYDQKQERFGDEPTDEQRRELATTQSRMEAQLLEVRRKADLELNTFRQALVDQFREQAKPVLRDVAAARGLSIVIPKNNNLLLTIDPAVEITDDVAARMPASKDIDEEPAPRSKKAAPETSAR